MKIKIFLYTLLLPVPDVAFSPPPEISWTSPLSGRQASSPRSPSDPSPVRSPARLTSFRFVWVPHPAAAETALLQPALCVEGPVLLLLLFLILLSLVRLPTRLRQPLALHRLLLAFAFPRPAPVSAAGRVEGGERGHAWQEVRRGEGERGEGRGTK